MNKLPISAAIITYNEEKYLDRCLSSIVDLCDQIVIVDSFSTDKTLDIARRYTDKIYQNEFKDFASQRNLAISKCTNDWVLKIDGDEEFPEDLCDTIRRVVWDNYPEGDKVYEVQQKIMYMDKQLKHCGTAKHWVKILWNNRARMEYNRSVHERIPEEGWDVYRLKAKAIHNTYQSISQTVDKVNKYSTLRARDIAKRKKNIRLIHLIFRPTYRFIRDYIIRGGFLDGRAGYALQRFTCLEIFWRYLKAWRIQRGEEI